MASSAVAHQHKHQHQQQKWTPVHAHAAPVASSTAPASAAPNARSRSTASAPSGGPPNAAADTIDSILPLNGASGPSSTALALESMRAAHLSLSSALARVDASAARGDRPALTGGLYQELVQEYAESPLASKAASFYSPPAHAPFANLAQYWMHQVSAVLVERWWPRLVAGINVSEEAAAGAGAGAASAPHRPGEYRPRADSGVVITCAQIAGDHLLAKAAAAVRDMPPKLLGAYARTAQLALELHELGASGASADPQRLEREKPLLHASYASLITMLETPTPALSPPLRSLALLPDKMLDGVQALVAAVAHSAIMRAEAGDDGVEQPYTRLFASLVASPPRNLSLVSPAHDAWMQWQTTVRLLGGTTASSTATPTRRPQIRNPVPVAEGNANAAAAVAAATHVPVAGAMPAAAAVAAAAPASASTHGGGSNSSRRSKDASNGSVNGRALDLPPEALVSRLTSELESFYSRRALSPSDLHSRSALLIELERIVRLVDPGLRVEAFGSSASGTAMKGSDMDVCIVSGTGKLLTPSKSFFVSLAQRLRKAGTFTHVQPILSARVPIIKLTERRTAIQADVAIGQQSTPYKSRLMSAYAAMDPRVPQLIAAVKYWAKRNDVNDGSRGTLNSFGWSLMVIQYLQLVRPAVLPSLQQQSEAVETAQARAGMEDRLEPEGAPDDVLSPGTAAALANPPVAASASASASAPSVSLAPPPSPFLSREDVKFMQPQLAEWQAMDHVQRHFIRDALHRNQGAAASASTSTSNAAAPAPAAGSHSLGALLIGFFHFYSRVFNHETMVVNIRAGGLSPRSLWGSKNSTTALYRFRNQSVLCIVDPFDHTDNVGRTIAPHVWTEIRALMGGALRQLQNGASFKQVCHEDYIDDVVGHQGQAQGQTHAHAQGRGGHGARDQAARSGAIHAARPRTASGDNNGANWTLDDVVDSEGWGPPPPAFAAPPTGSNAHSRPHSGPKRKHSPQPRRNKSPHGHRQMHTQAQQAQQQQKQQTQQSNPSQPSQSQAQANSARSQSAKAHFKSFKQQQQQQPAAAPSNSSTSSSHSAAGQPPPAARPSTSQKHPQ